MASVISTIGAVLTFEDGSSVTVHEDDILTNILFKQGKTETLIEAGRVRVICGRTVAYNNGPSDCPPLPYLNKYVEPTQLIIDHSNDHCAKITRINVSDLLYISEVTRPEDIPEEGVIEVGAGPEYKSLSEVIESAEEGTVIKLMKGDYTDPVTITKSITLTSNGGAILTAPIVINPVATAAEGDAEATPVEVVLDGICLAGKASLDVKKVDVLTIQNCMIGDYDFETRTNPIKIGEVPMLLTVENNVFTASTQTVYNLIECLGVLKDGSKIANNTFESGDCVHNSINLYNVEDDAHILLDNNVFQYGVNVMRIGFKGAPTGVMFNITDNIVDSMPAGVWSGMFVIQPYGSKTTSMAGITLNLSNNEINRDYVGYYYAAKNDPQWTASVKPTVNVNGKPYELDDISSQVNG